MRWWRDWRRRRILSRVSLDADAWRAALAAPLFGGLDAAERARLYDLACLFIAQKSFSGAAGFVMNEITRLRIAAPGALLILNLDPDSYAGWQEIIVYPNEFVPRREYRDESGVVHELRYPLLGEAWQRGPVILSAADVDSSMYLDGVNVVIHELAHKLDMQDGHADGLPPLHGEMRVKDWADAFKPAYEDLRRQVGQGRGTIIDPYAATSPAEFFAVLSEVFFETPAILAAIYPAVYAQMKAYYRQDPLRRLPADSGSGFQPVLAR
ncbi:MAG TPA: M90 family metallopeptidase [Thiobacillaceae bacterium]|nr:M90 family metallopeptidase [Thiobacillaceae bacterium]